MSDLTCKEEPKTDPTEATSSSGTTVAAAPSPPPPPRRGTSSLVIPAALEAVLRPHQIDALHFAWNKLVDEGLLHVTARSVTSTISQRLDLYQKVHGCILGHSMGLGKTLTTVTFILLLQAQLWVMMIRRSHAVVANSTAPPPRLCRALRVLILCPLSCVSHWQETIDEWVRPELFGRVKLPTYIPSASTGGTGTVMNRRNAILASFYAEGGILLMGYEEFMHYARQLAEAAPSTAARHPRVWSVLDAIRARVPASPTVSYLDMLESIDLAIFDEAHRMRKQSSLLVQSVIRHLSHAQLRVALTGTPIQNHLEEYNVMQSVVTGRLLDTSKFHRFFVAPIERGQCSDSTFEHFREMQRCVASLRLFFADTVHHCGPELLEAALPPRHEHVFFLRLSHAQEQLYRSIIKHFASNMNVKRSDAVLLALYHQAGHLCLHPCLVTVNLKASAAPDPTSPPSPNSSKVECAEATAGSESGDDVGEEVRDTAGPRPFSVESVDVNESPKLAFTLALIRHIAQDRHEKVVVYSRYISHISLVSALVQRDFSIAPLVLTGASTSDERRAAIDAFAQDPARSVMVASVGAGGVGIKLIAANHCILLDVGWNPANDAQATYRVFRYGQTRPVYVYRLAGFGTCEHVVFAYALQRSWLHRKIADAADPMRHAQHIKQNYLVYPCRIELDDDKTATDGAAEAEASPECSAAAVEERQARVLELCDTGCAPAAAVLRHAPTLLSSVQKVVSHAFLLRDTTDEVVSAMSARFADVEQKKASSASVVVAPALPAAPAARPLQSLLRQCETAVTDVAHEAANYCILHVIQRTERLRGSEEADGDAHRALDDAADEARDSAAVVRTTDATLRQALEALLPAALPGPVQAPIRGTMFLAETLLAFYEVGVHAVVEKLQTTRYAKLRTSLVSRIPFDAHRRHRNNSALADTLATRPSTVFVGMRPAEETYVCTELGLCRPFVKQCMVAGLLSCCRAAGGSVAHEAALQTVSELFTMDAPSQTHRERSPTAAMDGDLDDTVGDAETAGDLVTRPLSAAAVETHTTLTAFFEKLWPAFVEFYPPLLSIQLRPERALTARAFEAAKRTPFAGFLTVKAVAAAFQLQPYQGRTDQLECGRCRGAFLRRCGREMLSCPLCHYNAEFEAANHTRWYHQVFLFRHAVVVNSLESFSLVKAFTEEVGVLERAGEDSTGSKGLVTMLERLRRPTAPSLGFTEKLLTEGVEATLRVLPSSLRRRVALQCGTGLDMDLLREVLLANAHAVWASAVRAHVKAAVNAALHRAAGLTAGEDMPGGCAMPSMMLAVGLCTAAQTENVHYAHELLRDAAVRSPRHTLLRFVCDAVVKLLFLERLQQVHTDERTEAFTQRRDDTGPGSATASSRTATPSLSFCSDDEDDRREGSTGASPALRPWEGTDDRSSSGADGDSEEDMLPMPLKGLRARPADRVGDKRVRDACSAGRKVRRYETTLSSSSSSRSSSPFSGSSEAASVYAPCYSSDRESHADTASAGASRASSHSRSAVPTAAHTAEGETPHGSPHYRPARVNAYWIAHCQVYGTHSAEQSPVYIDEGPGGLTLLPAPPSRFWSVHMARMSGEGMTITAVIAKFCALILTISHGIRVIE